MIPHYQLYQNTLNNENPNNSVWTKFSPQQVNSASRQSVENLGIESPDMIPRNLLDGLTPALSPQMQPSNDLPPISLSLPPTSGNKGLRQNPYDSASAIAQNQASYSLSTRIMGEASKSYLQPVHMKEGGNDQEGSSYENPFNQEITLIRNSNNEKITNSSDQSAVISTNNMNPVLDDFHNRISSRWSLVDLQGNVYEFSKDQDGSRFIQRQMEAASEDVRFMIIQELVHHANGLTKDVFGNYVIQKALEYGTDDQRVSIVERLLGNIPELTLHTYACRVVQKALEYINHRFRLQIANELHGVALTCIYDQNGNHVLQKCIEVIPDNVDFIVNALKGNIWGVACHAYGCRVMQRLLEQSPIALRNAEDLLQEIFSHSRALTRNQYGNYVVQHLLISSGSKYRDAIVDIVLPEFFELACHKFASNVIEKVIVYSESQNHEKLMKKCLTEKDSDGVFSLVKLVTNPFGNYVVQRLFEFGTAGEKVQIASLLAAHMSLIERNTCSRHILPFILANAKEPQVANDKKTNKGNNDHREKKVNSKGKHTMRQDGLVESLSHLSVKATSSSEAGKPSKAGASSVSRLSHLPPTPSMAYVTAVQKSFDAARDPAIKRSLSREKGHDQRSSHLNGAKP